MAKTKKDVKQKQDDKQKESLGDVGEEKGGSEEERGDAYQSEELPSTRIQPDCDDEIELVRHMRIDFQLIPIEGGIAYPFHLEAEIRRKVKELIGENGDNLDMRIIICPLQCRYMLQERKFDREEFDKQLRDGDHGYVLIHGTTLGFVDGFLGEDWDDKFQNARRALIHGLNCTLYDCGRQLLITFLHPSQDARLFINLVSSSSSPLIFLLQRLPLGWFASLQNFFHSLAKIRDLQFTKQQDVSIQFKNYRQCYKALKKLCSHSLKRNGRVVDFQLTLKDEHLIFDMFDESLAYKRNTYKPYSQSAAFEALNNRVFMLQKEFDLVKSLTENSKELKGSAKARALNHRAKMLLKRLDNVKSVMEELGEGESSSTQTLKNGVSVLEKELTDLKPVLEDACIDRIQALEIRVAELEEELRAMKDGVSSSADQTLMRCKRLRTE